MTSSGIGIILFYYCIAAAAFRSQPCSFSGTMRKTSWSIHDLSHRGPKYSGPWVDPSIHQHRQWGHLHHKWWTENTSMLVNFCCLWLLKSIMWEHPYLSLDLIFANVHCKTEYKPCNIVAFEGWILLSTWFQSVKE